MNFLKSLFTFQSSVVPDDGGGGSGDDGVSVNPFDPSVHMSGVQQDVYAENPQHVGGDANHQAYYTPGLESLGRNIFIMSLPLPRVLIVKPLDVHVVHLTVSTRV